MHIIILFAVAAAAVLYVFGETAARWFMGIILAMGALAIGFIIVAAAVDINRQSQQRSNIVGMGHPR